MGDVYVLDTGSSPHHLLNFDLYSKLLPLRLDEKMVRDRNLLCEDITQYTNVHKVCLGKDNVSRLSSNLANIWWEDRAPVVHDPCWVPDFECKRWPVPTLHQTLIHSDLPISSILYYLNHVDAWRKLTLMAKNVVVEELALVSGIEWLVIADEPPQLSDIVGTLAPDNGTAATETF
jgi:hypothetical protein